MGLFDKLESKLEQGVNGAFARAFKAEVQPVEIAAGIRRAMDDRASSAKKGQRPFVPNLFTIELSPTDYERLSSWGDELDDELIASAQEHCDEQRYLPGGPLTIVLTEEHDLETGVFRLRPATAKSADALAHKRNNPRPQFDDGEDNARHEEASADQRAPHSTGARPAGAGSTPHTTGGAAAGAGLGTRMKWYLLGETGNHQPTDPEHGGSRHDAVADDERDHDGLHEYDAYDDEGPVYDNDPHHHRDVEHHHAFDDAHEDGRQLPAEPDDSYDDAPVREPARPVQRETPRVPQRETPSKPAARKPSGKQTRDAGTYAAPMPGSKNRRPAPQDASDHGDSTAQYTPQAEAPRPRAMSPRERPWLKIDGQRYPLLGAITVLGRDDDADIVIDDPGVSRRHSEIRITHDGPHLVMSVRDLGSTNGTFINGDRTDSDHVHDGDRITVGRTHMTIHLGDRA